MILVYIWVCFAERSICVKLDSFAEVSTNDILPEDSSLLAIWNWKNFVKIYLRGSQSFSRKNMDRKHKIGQLSELSSSLEVDRFFLENPFI